MNDTPRFIEREFQKFMTFVGFENHGEREQRIMRLAFFSGARGNHSLIKGLAMKNEPGDADVAMWQAIELELATFVRELEVRTKTTGMY